MTSSIICASICSVNAYLTRTSCGHAKYDLCLTGTKTEVTASSSYNCDYDEEIALLPSVSIPISRLFPLNRLN